MIPQHTAGRVEPPRRPCARPVGPSEDSPLLECAPQPRLGSQPKSCPSSLLWLGQNPGLRDHEGGSSFSAVRTSRPPLLGSLSALQSGVAVASWSRCSCGPVLSDAFC